MRRTRLAGAAALAAAGLLLLAARSLRGELPAKEWRKLEEEVAAWAKEKDVAKGKELLARISADDSARAVLGIAKIVELVDEDAFATDAGAVLSALKSPGGRAEVRKQAAAAKPWRVRLAMVQACALHLAGGDKAVRAVVEKALADAQPDVAMLAARALAQLRRDDAVDPLVARMEKLDKERGAVWEELRDALTALLGRRLGSGAEFRSRWEELKTKGGLAAVGTEKDTPAPAAEPGGAPRTVSLFGREVCSRVVFVLDISESMLAVDDPTIEVPPEGTRGADPSAKARADPRSRIERAKRELKKVLRGMSRDARVNLIAFSTATRLWRGGKDGKPPQVHTLDDKTREEAIKFVDSLEANGTTATDEALERAFQVEGARCFYLLSDGEPTKDGKNRIPTETILALIARNNGKRGIRIHTLGFVGADRGFMQAVAKATGGEYSDIK